MKRFVCFVFFFVSWDVVATASVGLRDTIPQRSMYNYNPSRRWVRELRNIIIVSPKNESETDTFNIRSPNDIYLETLGRTITEIQIVRVNPFGASITDSSYNRTSWLGRAGNAIHVNTREYVIRNALMFKEGDAIDGFRLAYSERYLRSMEYIGDARIAAIPVADNEAKIIVAVQDNLPYSLGGGDVSFDYSELEFTRGSVYLANKNVLGFGIEMQARAFVDREKDNLMGYSAMLRASQIGRSLISFQADYLDRFENQLYGFEFRRDFYTPATKYAGRFSYYNAQTPVRSYHYKRERPTTDPAIIGYEQWDAWLGRSFHISKNSLQNRNITVSFGMQRVYFSDVPEDASDRYYRFQNRTTLLSSLTFSQQAFYNASLIYQYGRTEDIPYGYLFSIIGGREINERYTRPYIGSTFSLGNFVPYVGYLSGAISYGAFFNKGADQGVLDVEMNYFSNLYVTGNVRQRTFINGQYTRQLFNWLEDQLVIDGEHGIPGFRNDSILGRHRLNLSVEQNVFLPREFLGFRFAVYAFSYLSWLGGYNEPIIFSNLYSSIGLGVRIRNNRLVFNTIQIQFAYFPNIPKNSKFRDFTFSGEKMLKPRDFMPNAPEIMPLY